jgi:hypothetical protein
MKSLLFIPFALFLGLIVGSWSPRGEIASLKEDLASTRELLKNQPDQKRSFSEVTSLLGIERPESSDRKETKTKEDVATSEDMDATDEAVAVEFADTNAVENAGAPPERTQEDMDDAIDKAVELWRMRVDIARSTFVSNTGMNDQQAMQFDQMVDNMNLKIGETIDLFAENLDGAVEVQMEAGIRVMNEITESIVEAYDEIDKTLPEGWRRNTGEDFSLLNFIDPEVGRPLVGLEDQLGQINGSEK